MLGIIAASIQDLIRAASAEFVAVYNRGDAAGVAALYAEDGQVLPPNSEIITGRPGIQAFWQAVMNMGVKSVTLETEDVERHDGIAHEVGRFALLTEDGQVIDYGKYLVIWKEQAGQWRLFRDIWNSSRPAQG